MLDFHKLMRSGEDNPEGESNDTRKPIKDIIVDSLIVAGMVGVGVYDPTLPIELQLGVVLKTFLVSLFGQLIYERKIKKVE